MKLEDRISDFSTGSPPAGRKLQVLCLDKCGTYALPFPCVWNPATGTWVNKETPIEAQVVGWREMPPEMVARKEAK